MASGRSPHGEDQMELYRLRPLAFALSHPLAKCIVFFCYRLDVFQVATRPPLFVCFLRVQLALFVAVGMLLAFARATESLFVFQLLLDGCKFAGALRAHQFCSSTSAPVIAQNLCWELLMALFAAFCAVVRGDIVRGEPASCACETHCFVPPFFCIVQHILVEHVSLQHLVASVAAPSFSPPLALHADFRLRREVLRDFLNTALGAGVARYTSHCPILGFVSRLLPLTVAKVFSRQTFVAY